MGFFDQYKTTTLNYSYLRATLWVHADYREAAEYAVVQKLHVWWSEKLAPPFTEGALLHYQINPNKEAHTLRVDLVVLASEGTQELTGREIKRRIKALGASDKDLPTRDGALVHHEIRPELTRMEVNVPEGESSHEVSATKTL